MVTGTCIGGGMLGLPVETGQAGFLPSLLLYLAAWSLMALTGLLILEVLAFLNREVNLVSMASSTLGPVGVVVSWILYLFLFYSLVVAYSKATVDIFLLALPKPYAVSFFLLTLITTIYLGTRFVTRLNGLLVGGLFIGFVALILITIPHVQTSRLSVAHWPSTLLTLPLVITAFGFQGVVPVVYRYFKGEATRARAAIIYGSLLSLAVYLIWQVIVLGSVPLEGPGGLREARQLDKLATWALQIRLQDIRISAIGLSISFFAITSSLLGVGVGLIDFLLDGLKLKRSLSNRLVVTTLTFTPATLIALQGGTVFYLALTYGGGIGCTLLLAALPIVMVWRIRAKRLPYQYRVAGSYWTLGLGGFLVLVVLGAIIVRWFGSSI